jgi:hypothetical protein
MAVGDQETGTDLLLSGEEEIKSLYAVLGEDAEPGSPTTMRVRENVCLFVRSDAEVRQR